MLSREIHLAARPVGLPSSDDFVVREVELSPPAEGEVLVRNDWMSVDPAMRGRMRDVLSYVAPFGVGEVMAGGAVGTVVQSRSIGLSVGDHVVHRLGWRELAVGPAEAFQRIESGDLSTSHHLGVLGMPGLTAYVGLARIAAVEPGDVVLVSAAAGAVGQVAARVARHLGAVAVVRSTGGPVKAARLTEELGYDRAIDYRAAPIEQGVRDTVPEGIDVYFDNVGGDHLRAALMHLNMHGAVALCGAVSQYNCESRPMAPDHLSLAISKRLRLQGFIVSDHDDMRDEWVDLATGWIADGSLRTPQTVYEGIDSAVDAFIGMLSGANTGKTLVRLAADAA
ncbi:NADP-dependent oxidoreductase [Aeromicrobium endophyticum]|uniref:NADP-dependent oxidoreductase n=1 Tax=Aeromicrobium endophyticum TaxID=2292704 RepID=UPI001F3A10C1